MDWPKYFADATKEKIAERDNVIAFLIARINYLENNEDAKMANLGYDKEEDSSDDGDDRVEYHNNSTKEVSPDPNTVERQHDLLATPAPPPPRQLRLLKINPD